MNRIRCFGQRCQRWTRRFHFLQRNYICWIGAPPSFATDIICSHVVRRCIAAVSASSPFTHLLGEELGSAVDGYQSKCFGFTFGVLSCHPSLCESHTLSVLCIFSVIPSLGLSAPAWRRLSAANDICVLLMPADELKW